MDKGVNTIDYHPSHSSSESFLLEDFRAVASRRVDRDRMVVLPAVEDGLVLLKPDGDALRELAGVACCCCKEEIVELKKSPSCCCRC